MILHEKHGLVLVKPCSNFLLEKLVVHLVTVHCLFFFFLIPLVHILRHLHPFHAHPSHVLKIHYKIIHSSLHLPCSFFDESFVNNFFFVVKCATWKSTHSFWFYNSVFGKIGKAMAQKRTEAPQKKKKQKNRIQCRTRVLKAFMLGTLTRERPWVRASFSASKPFDSVVKQNHTDGGNAGGSCHSASVCQNRSVAKCSLIRAECFSGISQHGRN